MTRNRRIAAGALVAATVAGIGAALRPAVADEPDLGAKIFAGRCAVCHGPEAAGIPGSFPPLHEQIAEFARQPAGRDYLAMVVTTGLIGELRVAGVTYRGVMPAQSGLSDGDIAAVLAYLASDRGKNAGAPALTAADVAAAHDRHAEHSPQSTRALRPVVPEP